jgi:AraC-like DNA-binding protein/ligand-binding sensor protein
MRLTVDLPKLRDLMEGFHTLTGLKIVLFDADYREILACPETDGPFCELMHAIPATRVRCEASNVQSFQRCRATGKLTIYRCHAGLLEATAPIADSGIVRGYVMFGQIGDRTDRAAFLDETRSLVLSLGREGMAADAAVDSIRTLSAEHIQAAARILEACICYLLRYDLVALRKGRLIQRIDAFIDAHLDEDLTPERLCAEFHLSRSALYRLFADHLGEGVAAMVRARRMDRARRLLRDTTDPIRHIASACGFTDDAHFRRVFRDEHGLSAKAWRERRG